MNRPFLVAGIILVVAVNILVLSGAAWNRTGEPDAVVALTERELEVGHGESEDSGIYLRLQWHHDLFPWFDAAKLRSIGYETDIPPGSEEGVRFYRKALPRRTFVVLEQEGAAWRAWLAGEEEQVAVIEQKVALRQATEKQLQEARKSLESKRTSATRLFPVDAGNDPSALRSRYGDRSRYLVVPAEVRLAYEGGGDGTTGTKKPAVIRGLISTVLISEMAVPRATAAPVLKLLGEKRLLQRSGYPEYLDGGDTAPRFRAVVTFGRRYEPWVTSLELM
jgi:hypothetical protein